MVTMRNFAVSSFPRWRRSRGSRLPTLAGSAPAAIAVHGESKGRRKRFLQLELEHGLEADFGRRGQASPEIYHETVELRLPFSKQLSRPFSTPFSRPAGYRQTYSCWQSTLVSQQRDHDVDEGLEKLCGLSLSGSRSGTWALCTVDRR